MNDNILFNLFPSDAGFNASKKLSKTSFNVKTPLVFNNIFLDYGDSYLNLITTQRTIKKYNWVIRITADYFPSCFTLIHFSGNNSAFLHVKLKYLQAVASFFKYSWWLRFEILIDVFANDYISRSNRFELTYCFLSPKRNERIYLRVFVNDLTVVPSLSNLYPSANWLEREVWDMYGVSFAGHSDLRRILTDYGFLGHALRKDFPLTGFFEIRYDDVCRRIVSEVVNLSQELRLFFFSTSWRAI